jgi:hypothetical protein
MAIAADRNHLRITCFKMAHPSTIRVADIVHLLCGDASPRSQRVGSGGALPTFPAPAEDANQDPCKGTHREKEKNR